MNVSSIGIQGLTQAQNSFNTAATRAVGASATLSSNSTDSVSLSDAAVSLTSAKDQFSASLAFVKVAEDLQKKTIDLLG